MSAARRRVPQRAKRKDYSINSELKLIWSGVDDPAHVCLGMIHELSKRLDALWRYDQYIANAGEDAELQKFWQSLKRQEQDNVRWLKEFVAKHCADDCF